jgi:2-keto-4-pentenoate hydratase/2-oxohepta-3-ene-1,7-dioic acid hydratase in catechol pathway
LPNFDKLRILAKVNGVVKREDSTAELLWKEQYIINYLTSTLTLYSGDVISKGTPSGKGMERQEFLKPGDTVSIEIETAFQAQSGPVR